jgi:hypothetical protein
VGPAIDRPVNAGQKPPTANGERWLDFSPSLNPNQMPYARQKSPQSGFADIIIGGSDLATKFVRDGFHPDHLPQWGSFERTLNAANVQMNEMAN